MFYHPAFPQPPSDDVVLWRYMDAEKFTWVLDNGRLFIPAADRLGDPWEGRTPQGYLNWWNQEIENAGTPELRATLTHNRDFFARIAAAFRSYFYVSCWHMNEHENYAMWNCYTENADAVAIRTTYRQLVAALPAYAYRGLVRYIDYASDTLPSMNLFEFITHKDKFFSYEQEVRAVFLPAPEDKATVEHFTQHTFTLGTDPTFRVFAPPFDAAALINQVVLGPRSSSIFQASVEAQCGKHSLPAPVKSRQSHPHAV